MSTCRHPRWHVDRLKRADRRRLLACLRAVPWVTPKLVTVGPAGHVLVMDADDSAALEMQEVAGPAVETSAL